MTAIERIAREIGVALAECGAEDSSPFAAELAGVLAELAREPSRGGGRRGFRRRRGGRDTPPRGETA